MTIAHAFASQILHPRHRCLQHNLAQVEEVLADIGIDGDDIVSAAAAERVIEDPALPHKDPTPLICLMFCRLIGIKEVC